MTIQEFLQGRETAEGETSFTNSIYVWGVIDGLRVFNSVISENLGQNLFCVREGDRSFSVEELVQELDEQIEFARRRVVDFDAYASEVTVGELAIVILSREYSCADSQ